MEEIACTCDGLPAHSHVYRVGLDPDLTNPSQSVITHVQDPYDIRIWVDWKEVARCFSQSSSQ